MSNPKVRPWDAPVVSALDQIEKLAGFAPDHVEWDHFRFFGTGASGPMHAVWIYAYPSTADSSQFVKFEVSRTRFTVTGPQHRDLAPSDVARTLGVPSDSAEKAATALKVALNAALAAFNAAHSPHTGSRATTARRRVPDLHTRPPDAATDGPSRGIGL